MAGTYKIDTIELRKLMIDKEIVSITELSEKSGVGRDTLSRLMRGKIQPSFGVILKIVDALEMPPETAGRIFFYHELT